jgi:hypothetical protein
VSIERALAYIRRTKLARFVSCVFPRSPCPRKKLLRLADINAYEDRVYSQGGEDGIIKEIFARIPHDDSLSNSACRTVRNVIRPCWHIHTTGHGIMIECDTASFGALQRRYADIAAVKCINAYVNRENVIDLFKGADVPTDFDLLSIDVDGNDYWIWDASMGIVLALW